MRRHVVLQIQQTINKLFVYNRCSDTETMLIKYYLSSYITLYNWKKKYSVQQFYYLIIVQNTWKRRLLKVATPPACTSVNWLDILFIINNIHRVL